MSDPMRSYSITVTMTPRQAVAAMRACELAASETEDKRTWRARERVMFGLWDAGWTFDEDGDEAWQRDGCPSIPDPV